MGPQSSSNLLYYAITIVISVYWKHSPFSVHSAAQQLHLFNTFPSAKVKLTSLSSTDTFDCFWRLLLLWFVCCVCMSLIVITFSISFLLLMEGRDIPPVALQIGYFARQPANNNSAFCDHFSFLLFFFWFLFYYFKRCCLLSVQMAIRMRCVPSKYSKKDIYRRKNVLFYCTRI